MTSTGDAFSRLKPEIDRLLIARAAVYPVRNEIYDALLAQLEALQAWLADQPPPASDAATAEAAAALRPIFVGGFYKSGTSLTRSLLDGHSHLSVLPSEGKLLQEAQELLPLPPHERGARLAGEWLHRSINPSGQPPFWLLGSEAAPYISLLHQFTVWLNRPGDALHHLVEAPALAYYSANPRRSPQARWWVDKTPYIEQDLPTFEALFPDLRLLYVVRNPLGTLAALKKMASQRGGQGFNLHQMLMHLRRSLQIGRQAQARLGPGRFVSLRYEDITAQPAATLERCAAALGLPFEDILLTPTANGLPNTANSAYQESRVSGVIHNDSRERWRQQLTSAEIALIVSVLGDEAEAWGYDLAEFRPRGAGQQAARARHWITVKALGPAARFGRRIGAALRRRLGRRKA